MIDLSPFAGETFAVLGLGKSGLATARALLEGGAEVMAWDDGAEARAAAEADGIPVVDLMAEDLDDIAALVISPGIPHSFPQPHPVAAKVKEAGRPLIGDVELLWHAVRNATELRVLDNPDSDDPSIGMPDFIGITGTNGKSTTTALVGHICTLSGRPTQVGGNLGTPVLSFDELDGTGIYVLELSSYQLELIHDASFDVGVLINISPDHLDRHGGMAGYVAAKARIFESPNVPQTPIVGVDDAWSAEVFETLRDTGRDPVAVSVRYPVEDGVFVADGVLYDAVEKEPVAVVDLRGIATLPGAHNWQNAACAFAACRMLGIETGIIAEGLRTFPGLAHRQQLVGEIAGVRFVNDSKATNADAAAKALASYDAIYWIAGGKPKDDDLSVMDPYLARVRRAFLIGEAAERLESWLGDRVQGERSGDLATAVRAAYRAARSEGAANPIVLLSPACASFDQFRNFEHRGESFAALVRELAAEESP